jgi:hypothetical protein
MKRFLFVVILVLTAFSAFALYFRFYFPFAEGNRSGLLVTVRRQGDVFPTWEGEMVQTGLRFYPNGPLTASHFKFSAAGKRVADSLTAHEERWMIVHYREYFGALPWRGNSRFIVDSILRMR